MLNIAPFIEVKEEKIPVENGKEAKPSASMQAKAEQLPEVEEKETPESDWRWPACSISPKIAILSVSVIKTSLSDDV